MVLFAVAIAMTRWSPDDGRPAAGVEQYRPLTIEDDALPDFPNTGGDAALGCGCRTSTARLSPASV